MIALITIQMKLNIKDLETVLSFYIIYYHGILTTTHPIFADISSKTKGAGIMFFLFFKPHSPYHTYIYSHTYECWLRISATISPYNANASLKMSIINNPTYNLFAPSAFMASLFPPITSSPPSDSVAQERFPPDARRPKPCTPASPITVFEQHF